jgi:hypothetical protein
MTRLRFLFAVLLTATLCPTGAWAQDAGYALKFDGASDLARLTTTVTIMGSGTGWESNKTVTLWLKPTGTASCTGPDPSSCDLVFGDRPRSWGISRGTVAAQDRLWLWNFDGTIDRVGIPYTPDEWIQISLVHGGGQLTAYKNGVLVGSVASGATPASSGASTLHFGGAISNATLNWTFAGEIDELQVWNVARSETEIAEGVNVQLTGTEPGLKAYYRMSNGSGTTLTDDSGNGRTGTLVDGGTGVPADGAIQWVPSGAFSGVANPNTPPVADPQSLTTAEETALPITLTGSDLDENPLTFRVVTQPTRGVLSGTAPDLVYTPLPNVTGPDSFTFVANDGYGDSPAATVSITILPVNDPPVAGNDSASTRIETAVVLQVLANDSDVDLDTLSISAVGATSNGTTINNGTSITYTPLPGFAGVDVFEYTVTDGNGGFATAQVTVTVALTEDPGLALRFNGSSNFATLGYTSQMLAPTWTTSKSVSLWVNVTGPAQCRIPTPAECDSIFGDRPQWWGINIGPINGADRIWLWNWDGNSDAIGVPYTVGEWLQITMVHENGVMKAYKNGVHVGSVATGATRQPNFPAQPILTFGGVIMGTKSYSFDGMIDELRIWNVALTPQEILDTMNQHLSGAESGLAAYYKMSNGSGTTVTDDSGHGWTATLFDGYQQIPAVGPVLWVPSGAFSVVP